MGNPFEGVIKLVGEAGDVPEDVSEFEGELLFVGIEPVLGISLGWEVTVVLLPLVGEFSCLSNESEDGVGDGFWLSGSTGGIDSGICCEGIVFVKGEGVNVIVNGRSSLGESGSWGIGIEVSV